MTENESAIRLIFFVGVFAGVAVGELMAPRRLLVTSKPTRWFANIGIIIINTALLRLIFGAAAITMALYAAQHGWGLFNSIEIPYWMTVVVSVIALDFVIYIQHVMFHAVPAFWRLHMMHHADMDIDVTTGTRFHPIEIMLSMLIKVAAVAVLGPPAVAVLIFEGISKRYIHVQSWEHTASTQFGSVSSPFCGNS